MDSFRIKLAAYFVLLSLLPVVAAFWGFSSLAEHDETRRVETRLEAELPTLLVLYQEQVLNAQATATELAGRSDLQRLLERGSRRELARLLAGHKHVEIILPNGTRVGWPRPALAVRRSARVVTGQGLAKKVFNLADPAFCKVAAETSLRMMSVRKVVNRNVKWNPAVR